MVPAIFGLLLPQLKLLDIQLKKAFSLQKNFSPLHCLGEIALQVIIAM